MTVEVRSSSLYIASATGTFSQPADLRPDLFAGFCCATPSPLESFTYVVKAGSLLRRTRPETRGTWKRCICIPDAVKANAEFSRLAMRNIDGVRTAHRALRTARLVFRNRTLEDRPRCPLSVLDMYSRAERGRLWCLWCVLRSPSPAGFEAVTTCYCRYPTGDHRHRTLTIHFDPPTDRLSLSVDMQNAPGI